MRSGCSIFQASRLLAGGKLLIFPAVPGPILPRFHTGPVAALTFPLYNKSDPANHKKTNQEEIA